MWSAVLTALVGLCGCATVTRIEEPFSSIADRLQVEGTESMRFGRRSWSITSLERRSDSLGMSMRYSGFEKPGPETRGGFLILRGELDFVPDGTFATTMEIQVRDDPAIVPVWLRPLTLFSGRRKAIECGIAETARQRFEHQSSAGR